MSKDLQEQFRSLKRWSRIAAAVLIALSLGNAAFIIWNWTP
jgi:hypothetical protein